MPCTDGTRMLCSTKPCMLDETVQLPCIVQCLSHTYLLAIAHQGAWLDQVLPKMSEMCCLIFCRMPRNV